MARASRHTRQKALLQSIVMKTTAFFSADDIYKKAAEIDSNIGVATIYRFLSDEVKAKRLFSYDCDRRAIYSRNHSTHCHFECENTGKVTHFELDNLDFLAGKIPGKISSISIIVKGFCEECMTCKRTEKTNSTP
jgi:Fe2+ or Zn2+ uptake regulation protein